MKKQAFSVAFRARAHRATVSVLVALVALIFVGCDSFRDSMDEDLTTVYTYFDYTDDDCPSGKSPQSVAVTYDIGTELSRDALPNEKSGGFSDMLASHIGYRLQGWRYYKNPATGTTKAGSNFVCDADDMVRSFVTAAEHAWLVASAWQPITYTVVLDTNGGVATEADEDGEPVTRCEIPCTYDSVFPIAFVYERDGEQIPVTVIRPGHQFRGWDTERDAYTINNDVSYKDGEKVTNLATEDGAVITLYAQWFKENITITFAANGGAGSVPKQDEYKIDDKLPDAGALTREGFDFIGWNTAADGSGRHYGGGEPLTEANWPNKDVTLYAQWTPIQYTVVFERNGGKGSMDAQTFTYGEEQSLHENGFRRIGYDFSGWATESGVPFGDGERITLPADAKGLVSDEAGKTAAERTLMLYAQWTAQVRRFSYDTNGGTGAVPESEEYKIGDKLPVVNEPTRVGYDFIGWNAADGNGWYYVGGEPLTEANWPNEDVTLYAQWELIQYTVVFEKNGGAGSMAEQTFTYGVAQSLSVNSFSRTGYDFSGWATDARGSGTRFDAGASITLPDDAQGLVSGEAGKTAAERKLTLYAQWTPETCTFRFFKDYPDQNYTDQQMTYADVEKGTAYLSKNEYKREGFKFDYWEDDKRIRYADGERITTDNWRDGLHVLYARWKPLATVGDKTVFNVEPTEEGIIFTAYGCTTYHWYIYDGNECIDTLFNTEGTLTINYADYADRVGRQLTITLLGFNGATPMEMKYTTFIIDASD